MQNYIFVALGAAFGGALRYWVADVVERVFPLGLPYGTLAVNVLGSFLLGFLVFYFDSKGLISPEFRVLLTIGFCGGFTTFSTFSFETFAMFREFEFALAIINIFLNMILTLLAVMAAFYLSKLLGGR